MLGLVVGTSICDLLDSGKIPDASRDISGFGRIFLHHLQNVPQFFFRSKQALKMLIL